MPHFSFSSFFKISEVHVDGTINVPDLQCTCYASRCIFRVYIHSPGVVQCKYLRLDQLVLTML
jgi:hypothetical protein